MTRDTALSLLKQYGEHLRALRWDPAYKHATQASVVHNPTMSEADLRFPEDGSEKKAMRWLGFVQGCCYSGGIFTLEEIKEHSRTGKLAL